MNNDSIIMAILQEQRVETAIQVQNVLTKYGCHIRVRLGLHDAAIDSCSPSGLILLQLCCEKSILQELEQDLVAIQSVKVKYMTLDF
ncbi:hypothetical protein [Pelosinus sp. sgz500959]|uniref:hypothetical protein n=1 Tax=Pelosinus sp. sgz500959 TaxID=3242472 RepID=UPI003673099A